MFRSAQHGQIKRFKISPLGAFTHLYQNDSYAFFYESLEQGGGSGRYSIIGSNPGLIFWAKNGIINLLTSERKIIKMVIHSPASENYYTLRIINSTLPPFPGAEWDM